MPSKQLTDRVIPSYHAEPGERLEVWDTVTPGLHLRVSCDQRRGNRQRRVWYVRYRPKGTVRQRRQKVGEWPAVSLSEARKRARGISSEVDDARDPKAELDQQKLEAEATRGATVGALVVDFLQYQEDQGVASRDEQRRILDKDVLPLLKSKPVSEVDANDVERIVERITRRGRRKKAKFGGLVAANRAKALLVQIFNFALQKPRWRSHVAKGNPARNVAQPLKNEAKRTARDRTLSDAELRRLWHKAAELKEGVVCSAFRFRMVTAQRQTEILGMRKGELKRIQREAPAFDAVVWHVPAWRMKKRRPHLVPLSPLALSILAERLDESELEALLGPSGLADDVANDPVFESPRKSLKGSPIGRVNRSFRRWKELAEVEDFVGTDLRRTVNTRLASFGVRHEVKMAVLSHLGNDVNTQHYDRYDYLIEKYEALCRWSRDLERILSEDENSSGEVVLAFPGAGVTR